ncbi:RimK family protein [Limibacter armeniacum]|uniref:RimK family protein n=1 Tax=Limibacter armeniacum TaxID=466084 RepID=UPI002FE66603
MRKIIVVDNPKQWKFGIEGVDIIAPKDYLTDNRYSMLKNVRIFNLCKDYSYQSKGYYVSLLAEARGHKPLPDVKNIIDVEARALVRVISDSLYDLIQQKLKKIKSNEFELSVYFGQNVAKQYVQLCRELHKHLQVPLLRAKFVKSKEEWILQNVRTIALNDIPEDHLPYVEQFAREYFARKRYVMPKEDSSIYDLAILINDKDPSPPSNKEALQKFTNMAAKIGFAVEIIKPQDFNRLSAFDALFIRTTTNVNDETYRFARRAASEGIVVIDSPDAIMKCSNKVYLAELLTVNNIPQPKTMIVHQRNKKDIIPTLGLPCVLKLPDSSFSLGVKKVKTKEELEATLKALFKESDLIIAQEYAYTDFDWRIGVLDGKVIYACRYYMAKGHWQIYNWNSRTKQEKEGDFDCVPAEEVPADILEVSLKACSLIAKDGLFGVDVKEVNGKPIIIEVNDNPSIDAGVEDFLLKDELYLLIMQSLKNKIEDKISVAKNGKQKVQLV